jgi:hypothetical protein
VGEFLCTGGECAQGSSHGRDSELRSLGSPRDLLSSWFLAHWTALPTGCCLQSGRDGRPAQGGRARQSLRLLCGPAQAVAPPTPELVSNGTHPESPGSRRRSPLPPIPQPPVSQSINPSRIQAVHRHPYPNLEPCFIFLGSLVNPTQVLEIQDLALGMSCLGREHLLLPFFPVCIFAPALGYLALLLFLED